MAIVAELNQPVTIDGLNLLEQIPVGGLTIGGWDGSINGLTGGAISNRFPTPPSAVGFLTLDPDEELDHIHIGATPPYVIFGALAPRSDFLEPTLGQIWPRIG